MERVGGEALGLKRNHSEFDKILPIRLLFALKEYGVFWERVLYSRVSGQIILLSRRYSMYFIGVILFFVVMFVLGISNGSVALLVDFPSILLILALSIPTLVASGLLPDFLKGFKLMGQKVNYYSKIDLERILEAHKLATSVLFLSGGMVIVLSAAIILTTLDDLSHLGPSLALALFSVLYSLILNALILPIKSKVRVILKTME